MSAPERGPRTGSAAPTGSAASTGSAAPAPSRDAADACDPHGGCITCSDEGVPMRVVRVREEGLATCEAEDGRRRDVLTGLLSPVVPGDVLLVHAGTALLKLEAR